MIKTTIVFDYGTEEFAVTVYDQHLDPAALLVRHRGTYANANGDFMSLSTHRIEVRHEGQPDDLELDDIIDVDDADETFETLAQLADRGELTQAEIDEWVYGRGCI